MYLVSGPTRLRTRLLQLGAALAAVVVAAGWYIALVELWPAADRPYIGGSTTNSLLELALGYNGIGRLLGGSGNGGGGGPGGSGNAAFGGSAGITRLFTGEIALEASWPLPAALVLLVAGLAVTMQAPRTDRLRAALLLWGGWTLVTGVVGRLTLALAAAVTRPGRSCCSRSRTRRSPGCGGSCSPRAWWRWPASCLPGGCGGSLSLALPRRCWSGSRRLPRTP